MVYVWAVVFDVLTVVVSISLLSLALWLWKFFRGGIMAKPWKAVIATSVFLLGSSAFCLAEMIVEAGEWTITLHGAIDFVAIALLTYALYLIYRAWSSLGKGKSTG